MKLGREIKLCDPTNIGMVKIMHFLENSLSQYCCVYVIGICNYVHVTDEKDGGKRNFIHGSVSMP